MLVDGEIRRLIDRPVVENVRDRHLTLVVQYEVVEGHRGLKADKGGRQVEQRWARLSEQVGRGQATVETVPRAARRVDLVGLKVAGVLQVIAIVVDEVPDHAIDIVLRPSQPILDRGLDVKDGPTVQLGRVHFAHLILLAMLPAIDGGEDDGVGVEVMPGQLAAIGQLKDALTDLDGRAINLVQKQDARLVAALCVPVRRTEGSRPAVRGRQTEQVALGHLRGAPLDNGQTQRLGGLIDHAGLTNAVAASEQHRLANRGDVGCDCDKGLEVYCHDTFLTLVVSRLSTTIIA